MDKSEAKAWIDENAERLKHQFGLHHWRLKFYYECIPETADGKVLGMQVKARPEYETAHVFINFNEIDDVERLEYDLKHELMHIIHSPFEHVYTLLKEMLDENNLKVINAFWNTAEELTVRNLERMSDCHMERDDD